MLLFTCYNNSTANKTCQREGEKLKNLDVRKAAKAADVRLWEIAEEIGINDGNFSRKLRHELPEDQKRKVIAIIEKIAASR